MEKELETVQQLINIVSNFVVNYSFQILGAILILIIGFKVANWISNLLLKFLEQKKVDITLSRFIASGVRITTIVFVVIIAMGKFGISIAPFIAALGALAFGSSFALQGPLSNYGAGVSIILSRPFVVGDTINVQGVNGIVEEVHLALTVLKTEDGEKILIPNKHIVGEIITNSYSNKIVETSVGISYSDDPEKAIAVIGKVLEKMENVVQEPKPQVGIDEFADSSINIGLRYLVPTEKFFETKFRVNQGLHAALKEANINIPFPQRDVHLIQDASEA